MKIDLKNIEDLTSKFLNDGLTAQEEAELRELLKESGNKVYFKKMYAIWYATNCAITDEDVEHAYQKALFRINSINRQQPGEQITVQRRFPFWRVAVAVAALVGGVFLYYAINTGKHGRNLYGHSNTQKAVIPAVILPVNKVTVPLGSRSIVELPDGTIVTLNAGSCLQYAASFGEKSREIILEGEGYFKVARNEAIPFIVRAKDVTIKALGTEFNVTAYPEEKMVRTTLVKGSVSIREDGNQATAKELILKPQQTVIIKYTTESKSELEVTSQPSNNNHVAIQNPDVAPKSDVVLEESAKKTLLYTSWKDPRWIIESEPLEEVAVKLQRRYDVRIIILDDDLKRYPFSGIITDETLEQVLEIMKATVPIDYTVKRKTVWLKIDLLQYEVFEKLMKK